MEGILIAYLVILTVWRPMNISIQFSHDLQKGTAFSKVPKICPFFSLTRNIHMKKCETLLEWYWQEKTYVLGEKLSQFTLVHHKPYVILPGFETQSPR